MESMSLNAYPATQARERTFEGARVQLGLGPAQRQIQSHVPSIRWQEVGEWIAERLRAEQRMGGKLGHHRLKDRHPSSAGCTIQCLESEIR